MLRLNISCQNISLTMKHTTGRLSGTGRYASKAIYLPKGVSAYDAMIRADSSPLNILKNNYKIKVQIN